MGTLLSVDDGHHQQDRQHFTCPFCASYDVLRMYVGLVNVDSCECAACGSRWDEDSRSGRYRGRSERSSVLMPRQD